MTIQQELYDESLLCCPGDVQELIPIVLWRTLERTHMDQFCPQELVERFAQELALNFARQIERDILPQAGKHNRVAHLCIKMLRDFKS